MFCCRRGIRFAHFGNAIAYRYGQDRSLGQRSLCGNASLVELNPGRFQFSVVVECVNRLVSSVAALFEPAEWHRDVTAEIVVNANGSNA